MNITVAITKYEKIEVAEEQQLTITRAFLRKTFSMRKGMYLSQGEEVMEEVEHHSSHSWYSQEFIRIATESDITYFKFIKALNEKLSL